MTEGAPEAPDASSRAVHARRGARWLAALVPLAVVAALGWSLARPEAPAEIVAVFEERLALGEPEVVVVGSSLAKTDVDEARLADRLGVPRRNLVLLTLPRATAPHVYAILRNRVFGAGHRPRVVLWVGALTAMATPDVLGQEAADRLADQLEGDEDAIARKTFGLPNGLVLPAMQARARAGQWRIDGVADLRNRLVGAWWTGVPDADVGQQLGQRARTTVLREAALSRRLHQDRPTGLGLEAQEDLDLTGLDVTQDSLIPDLLALTAAHGARLALVRAPFPPSHADNDQVPFTVETEVARLVGDAGGLYLDLRGMPLSDHDFRDMRHLTDPAATRLTDAVAEALMAGRSEAATGWRVVGWDPPDPPVAQRVDHGLVVAGFETLAAGLAARGMDDRLPFLVGGQAVDGRVAPEGTVMAAEGEEVTWRGPTVPRPRGMAPVAWIPPGGALRLEGVGAGGRVRSHERVGPDGRGRVREVVVDPDKAVLAGGEGWILVEAITSPDGALRFGDPAAVTGAAARMVGGVHVDTLWEARFEHAPPAVDHPSALGTGTGGLAYLTVPGSAAWADDGIEGNAHPHRCSPLRVLEDGVALPRPNRPCAETAREGGGRTCHHGDRIYLTTVDGSDPRTNGRDYTVGFDPERGCDRRWVPGTSPERDLMWILPGDRAEIALPDDARERLVDGVDRVAWTVDAVQPSAGDAVHLEVLWNGRRIWRTVLRADHAGRIEGRGVLPVPLGPRPTDLSLRLLHTRSDGGLWRLARWTWAGTRQGQPTATATTEAEGPEGDWIPDRAPLSAGGPEVVGARRAEGVWSLEIPALRGLDDASLGGPWSPVQVQAGGVRVPRVAVDQLGRCRTCFAHTPGGLQVRAPHRPAVSWAVQRPWRTPDGARTWWLLPGRSLLRDGRDGTRGQPVADLVGPDADRVVVQDEGWGFRLPGSAGPVLIRSLRLVDGDHAWWLQRPPVATVGVRDGAR